MDDGDFEELVLAHIDTTDAEYRDFISSYRFVRNDDRSTWSVSSVTASFRRL